jgi:uncharacterized protein (TIGR02996 family)
MRIGDCKRGPNAIIAEERRMAGEKPSVGDRGSITIETPFFIGGVGMRALPPGTELQLESVKLLKNDYGTQFVWVKVLASECSEAVGHTHQVPLENTSFAERFRQVQSKGKSVSMNLTPLERDLLATVVAELGDDGPKLVYADWLEEHGENKRAAFLRAYVKACKSREDLPEPNELAEEWLELIGFRLMEKAVEGGVDEERRNRLRRVARPALRMKTGASLDLAVGASKIGGFPDLPEGFRWPPGGDCHATFNDDTGGTDRLAGFLAQVNFAEIAHTQAARNLLPEQGVLSFFCFQDIENDNPDAIGALALFFPDPAKLVPTKPPKKLTEGNTTIEARRLTFEETLDLPENYKSPWTKDLNPDGDANYADVLDHFRDLNFENVLGYARSTTGGDPTPSKQSRHLILLENAAGCRLHIQIDEKDLAARRFDKITLNWVDFD